MSLNVKTPHLNHLYTMLCLFPQGLSSLLSQAVSTGGGGHVQLLRRAMTQLTYRSLCPPDDLTDRGLLGIPSALYAHDALRLWKVIARWVRVGAEKWRVIGERESGALG